MQHSSERPLDELTLRVHPEGTTRFTLYEDDGRTQGYREGRYARILFECVAAPDGVTVRIGAATGDASVVPARRRYHLEMGGPAPRAVVVDGHGELPRREGPEATGAGWWVDPRGFTGVRLPDQPAPLTVRLRT
jgi:hypothetical protein